MCIQWEQNFLCVTSLLYFLWVEYVWYVAGGWWHTIPDSLKTIFTAENLYTIFVSTHHFEIGIEIVLSISDIVEHLLHVWRRCLFSKIDNVTSVTFTINFSLWKTDWSPMIQIHKNIKIEQRPKCFRRPNLIVSSTELHFIKFLIPQNVYF